MNVDAAALQSYLRDAAHAWAIVITTPSFDVCLHPADALVYLNYALPHSGADAAAFHAEHAGIERAFAARERTPRFEFVDGASPELAAELAAAGYREEPATISMTCTPDDLGGAVPAGITLEVHDERTGDDAARAAIRVRDRAFGLERAVDAKTLDAYRKSAAATRPIVAREGREIIGVGTLMPIAHGIAEVAGIGVAEHARGRGIGGAITAHLARLAFAGGAQRAFLTAGSDAASRVYARVGFRAAPYRVRSYVRI